MWTNYFIILYFQLPQLKRNCNPTKIQNCKPVPIFINWGSFSNREKRLYKFYLGEYQNCAPKNLAALQLLELWSWEVGNPRSVFCLRARWHGPSQPADAADVYFELSFSTALHVVCMMTTSFGRSSCWRRELQHLQTNVARPRPHLTNVGAKCNDFLKNIITSLILITQFSRLGIFLLVHLRLEQIAFTSGQNIWPDTLTT